MWTYNYTNELYHHGIKGMKWGVRRFQKKDGTRIRNRSKKKELSRSRKEDLQSEDYKNVESLKKKKLSQLSNAELRALNERQGLERTYRNNNRSKISKGMKFVATAAATTGTILALYNNSSKLISLGKSAGNKIVGSIGNMVVKDLNSKI